jgi:hypothetical protein
MHAALSRPNGATLVPSDAIRHIAEATQALFDARFQWRQPTPQRKNRAVAYS